ncbi:MAG: hypothetical protein ABII13_01290 [Patescibacteria group bacterium]|nr:hypothetical protein [Patescibacteria group bacterium]
MCKVDKTSEVIDAAISYLIYKLKELDQQHQKNKEAILELLEGVATQDDQWDRRLENTRISHEIVKAKMSVLIELFLSFVRFVPRDKRQEITQIIRSLPENFIDIDPNLFSIDINALKQLDSGTNGS